MFQSCSSAGFAIVSSSDAVSRLVADYQQLIPDDDCVLDTKSEHGFNAATVFVESLAEAARALGLIPADRSYRPNFTVNYRALFPDASRSYRVDILEASLEQHAVIWVNGDKFEFSTEAMTRAETLKRCLANVTALLKSWCNSRSQRAELRSVLEALDTAWASFESKYIFELIDIEARQRKLIVRAIEHEQKLTDLETRHGQLAAATMQEYMDFQRNLVQTIGRLNSVANSRRKGRDDLSVEILWDSMKTIQRCDYASFLAAGSSEDVELLSAARSLSGDVVDSFLAMRKYLRETSTCLERVDPHLSNNVGLVGRLVDWEETWEVGKKYVQNSMILNGICDLVAEIRSAQLVIPDLKNLCEECDVELFMVLPRILWLGGLIKPAVYLQVFSSLLPHRFASIQESGNTSQEQWPCDSELNAFIEQFSDVYALLMQDLSSAGWQPDDYAWEMLVKRVVLGSEARNRDDVYGTLPANSRVQTEAEVESFMNTMEGWSMEVQRHCAEDWNMFMSIILKCLSGKDSQSKELCFQV